MQYVRCENVDGQIWEEFFDDVVQASIYYDSQVRTGVDKVELILARHINGSIKANVR